MSSFGQLISEHRKRLGMSQKQLASRILKEDGQPISAQYLNDLERDRRNAPSEHLLQQFATILQLSLDHLCLAAGTLPADLREHSSAEAEKVDKAFRAFRKVLRGK